VAVNALYLPNPGDGTTTYSNVRIERAVNNAGAPGAFTEITNIAIDASDEFTAYSDTTGATDSFYQHRWANAAGTIFSGYSDYIQAGDSPLKQRLKGDIPDADLTDTFWNRWITRAMLQLYNLGVWYEGRATITITKLISANVEDERYVIPAALRQVFSVEAIDTSTTQHIFWLQADEWSVENRTIRFIRPSTQWKYVLHGKAQYQQLGELTNDVEELAYHLVVRMYLQKRINDRRNFRKWVVFDRTSDITLKDLRDGLRDVLADINEAKRAVEMPEPAMPAEM
jgi:hypothetical protein